MTNPSTSLPLELWAGIEATVNRLGDTYLDQLERSGHAVRTADLERLARLGITAVRYPILWERTAPRGVEHADWSWPDERLQLLQQLNVKPIIGLVHHGSGPKYTHLTDPAFPEKLAEFASAVARRYPWVEDYTPINEPLTTARFSCLYGHWYPHVKDALAFARAVVAECRGVALAMREIRKVNPSARLIQTEDLGKTFSTPRLSYQAEFENERRWLTFDLLCGRVQPSTPMWDYLLWVGLSREELEWFLDNETAPDVIGINHYITSERFLDHRWVRYPRSTHGGNGRDAYADVEAVRVCAEGTLGPKALLQEAWDRYGLPLAVTEVHLACTRDEQLRWFNELWTVAQELHRGGIEIRAVTAWSAFGAYDWNTLLTRNDGDYEPGIFDLRAPAPRPTALARMVSTLAAGEKYDHPVLDSPGWWHRFDRLTYPPVSRPTSHLFSSMRGIKATGESSRPLVITGATGTLGQAFARICEKRGLAYYLLSRQELDIADIHSIQRAFERCEPWAVINAAGYVRVDEAETDVQRCMRENAEGPATLASACAHRGIKLVTFSSDLVFDGQKQAPYQESDVVSPLNVYGQSKTEAEVRVLNEYPEALVIRTSAFFGPWDDFNFVKEVIESISTGRSVFAANDLTVSPTYVPDLVNASLDLLIDEESGIWHLANTGSVTWAEFAMLAAEMGGFDARRIEGRPNNWFGLPARRPAFSVLSSERAELLPSLERGLESYFRDRSQVKRKSFISA